MEKLSQILWRERELLDVLHYRIEVERLVLATGRSQWLLQAAKEVSEVLETLRATELLRSVAADEVAASIGLGHNPSLRALAEAVEEPWRTILLEHHEAFASITREIVALADANRELITSGYTSAREALLTLADGTEGYGADGTAVTVSDPRQRLLDWSL